MSRDNIINNITSIVNRLFNIDPKPEEDLTLSGLDSLDYVELIMELEKEYDTSISDYDIETQDLTSISKLSDYLLSRL